MSNKEEQTGPATQSVRLSAEDLSFWWLDSPMQPTTMALLMVLDRVPHAGRLRHALERAISVVPRLGGRCSAQSDASTSSAGRRACDRGRR